MAAGSRPGFAQSVFQVGGTVGSALGPLGAAIVVARWGQRSLGAFSALALVSTCVLSGVGSLSVAIGLVAGGSIGDRIGRRQVIQFSILGVLPFALALPYASLVWTEVLTVLIGFILASAFPAIIVYGQELVPGRLGMVSGLFFGLSFGAAGFGAGLLGNLADSMGIEHVYRVCAFLPGLGILGVLLPDLSRSSVMQIATSEASDGAGASRNCSAETWPRLGPDRWRSARRVSGRGAARDR